MAHSASAVVRGRGAQIEAAARDENMNPGAGSREPGSSGSGSRQPGLIQRYWHNSRLTSEIWRSVDIAVLLVVLVGVFPLANPEFAEPGLEFLTVRVTATNVLLLCLCIVVWPMIFSSFGLYDPTQLTSPRSEALRIIGACTVVSATPVLFMITGE